MQGWSQDDPVAPSRAPPPAFDLDCRGETQAFHAAWGVPNES